MGKNKKTKTNVENPAPNNDTKASFPHLNNVVLYIEKLMNEVEKNHVKKRVSIKKKKNNRKNREKLSLRAQTKILTSF